MPDRPARDVLGEARLDARKWWPTAIVDEGMPEGRASPTDWIVRLDDGFALADGDKDGEPWLVVAIGDIVEFTFAVSRGEVAVTIHPDGGYEAHGPVPDDATYFWEHGDSYTAADTMAEFARFWAECASPSEPERIDVAMNRWGEELFRLCLDPDGKPKFVAEIERLDRASAPPATGS